MRGSEIVARLDVSRETLERLEIFVALITKWNERINLVSRGSIGDIWERHIVDSVQVFRLATDVGHWADLGSGGGFPGMIVAILAEGNNAENRVTLIESDQRKAAFLRAAARELGVTCQVISQRVELAEPQQANVVSARALADLATLLDYSERHLAAGGVSLFPKGVTWQKELDAARSQWRLDVDVIESQTMPGAAILKIEGASRV